MNARTPAGAREAALAGLIDHAALFPPASLPLDEALAEDRRVRAAASGSIVGRFVVPAALVAHLPREEPLRLSVVADGVASLEDPRVEALELPPGVPPPDRGPPEVYVELPRDADVADHARRLARKGLRAKLRCGGASVPAVERVAETIRVCREQGVPLKATAGLHHAVRRDGEHGFLNLLAAAVFGDEEAALAEEDPNAFRLDDDAFRWRDRAAGADEVARVRRELFVGFGSCSVREPVDELTALGILPW